MRFTLAKVKEDGTEVSVRKSETERGGSTCDEYETTSKTRAGKEAKFVNRRMENDYIGVRIYDDEDE